MAHLAPAEDLPYLEPEDALTAGTLGFMPRLLVLTTLPHHRPESHRFERVNGRYRLQMRAPRRPGLPYGSYARLILAYLTTQAVRNKGPQIDLGATPNDLARRLGLTVISGPRGTAHRLVDQLVRLLSMRLTWQTSLGVTPRYSGSAFVGAGHAWSNLFRQLLPGQDTWRSHIALGQQFFEEITRSAIPVDLRAIHQLRRSPLAMDLYVWLTYRMNYLGKPTTIPWESLQAQSGSGYSRLRDFRRRVPAHLESVVRVYPTVRISFSRAGLCLYPSSPHVAVRSQK